MNYSVVDDLDDFFLAHAVAKLRRLSVVEGHDAGRSVLKAYDTVLKLAHESDTDYALAVREYSRAVFSGVLPGETGEHITRWTQAVLACWRIESEWTAVHHTQHGGG